MDPTPTISAPKLFDLEGQNVLITGATRGIGAACAVAFAQAGAGNIILVVRPGTTSSETAVECKAAGAKVHLLEGDLADLDSVRTLFDRALALVADEIHILVNCAGIQRRAPSVDFAEQDFDDVSVLPIPPSIVGTRIRLRAFYSSPSTRLHSAGRTQSHLCAL
jgi:2-deoxy-D-gluconate 3-dehydrogenase